MEVLWSGTTSESTLGLNIVAVPEPPKAPSHGAAKKKKNNKYERRRRRAQQHKEEQQRQTLPHNAAAAAALAPSTADADDPHHPIESDDAVASPQQTDRDRSGDIDGETDSQHDDDASVEEADQEDEGDLDPGNEPGPARSTRLPQDAEERAKYLAEFHARPLELDRRAGATARALARSKDSTHLFDDAMAWGDLAIHPRIVQCLQTHLGHSKPTRIQIRTIPEFSAGGRLHNLLIHSETGSGKTLAYFVPILQSLAVASDGGSLDRRDRAQAGTRCIILCPTRELASQTLAVVEQLCAQTFNWIVAGCLFGEERRKSEKARIRRGLTIVVATPGRLLDHLTRTEGLLMACKAKVEWLVLDEADRLLDMGLGDQVTQIVQRLRANQPGSGRAGITWRSVLISATITRHVEALAKDTLLGGDGSWVWVKGVNHDVENSLADSTPRQVSQNVITVSAKLKLAALVAFLAQRVKKQERSVVFMSTCAAVDFYHALLLSMNSIFTAGDESTSDGQKGIFGAGCAIYKLHGSVPHGERQQILRQFFKHSDGKQAGILLSTDVAARGLNLPDIDWTVQFDPPAEVADYVHRTGRVGRAGRKGHSLLFLLPSERAFLDVLKKHGVKKMTAVSLASTLNAAALTCEQLTQEGVKRSGGGFGASADRKGEAFCAEIQHRLEECIVKEDAKTVDEAKAARKELSKGQRRNKPRIMSGALVELARNAFVSHLRAYPTKEKCLRSIFVTKSLHYGHVARSFALKEPPTKLTKQTAAPKAFVEKESRKQNLKMSFERLEEGGATGADPAERDSKRRKRENLTPQQAKALLMANASRLEQQSYSY